MKTRLGRLGANADEKDCQIISRELEDIAAKSTIPDELQERILSSAMRKAGVGMKMTMDKRKEDAHNPENLNAVKRNHTAAACIALLLTAAAGALFIFGGRALKTDDVTPAAQSEEQHTQSASETEQAEPETEQSEIEVEGEQKQASCPFAEYTPYPVRVTAPAYAPYLLEVDEQTAEQLYNAITNASWELIPTETPLPDGEAYLMFVYNSGKPFTLVFYGDYTVEYKSETEISRYKTDDTSVFGLIAKTANPKNLGDISDALIWCEPEDLTSEGVWKEHDKPHDDKNDKKSRIDIEYDKDKGEWYEKYSGKYLTYDEKAAYPIFTPL